ncbi:unnamed protein product [Absidia cylindrospora]
MSIAGIFVRAPISTDTFIQPPCLYNGNHSVSATKSLSSHSQLSYLNRLGTWGHIYAIRHPLSPDRYHLIATDEHLIYLESLTLQSCQGVTDTSFQHLPRHCPHLRSLHVASCQITKRSIIALGHHCRQLESLFLANCHRIHFGVFSTLVYDDTGPPSTTTTTKTSSTHVLQESTAAATALDKYVTDGLEQHHLDDSQRLATLSAHRWYPPPSKGIPWPHLSTVQLGGLFDAGTANMIAFIETHRHLQRIHLTQTSFSNAVLDAMATSCGSRLVSLQVPGNTWLTSQGVRQLVCLCPLLRYVNVDGCDMLANEFPEANAGCQVDVTERLDRMGAAVWVGDESPPSSGTNSGGGGTLFLHHLDQDAIDNIRLANSNMDFFLPPMD